MTVSTKLSPSERVIADKILHILGCFPKISPSMLQISLGSSLPTDVWKPVLEYLITTGDVYRYSRTVQNPAGRAQAVTVISSSPDDGQPI